MCRPSGPTCRFPRSSRRDLNWGTSFSASSSTLSMHATRHRSLQASRWAEIFWWLLISGMRSCQVWWQWWWLWLWWSWWWWWWCWWLWWCRWCWWLWWCGYDYGGGGGGGGGGDDYDDDDDDDNDDNVNDDGGAVFLCSSHDKSWFE